jgi:uroporphyrinogen III methyltransferase/synthase
VECLSRADLVLYDRLVPEALLDHASGAAKKVCVTELAARHVDRASPVLEMMIQSAREGKIVVRLKGGDPLIFGRGGEEGLALREAGIPFELVPGVTAALAAASCAGVPLTHRGLASAVTFVTGHEDAEKPGSTIDWSALARFPGTLVVYMAISRLGQVVENLLRQGKAPGTPCVLVHGAGTNQQRSVEATLQGLPAAVQGERVGAPSVVIIGDVVGLRRELAWFESRPLFGLQVLITRPLTLAKDLAQHLEELGAVVRIGPAIGIGEPADWRPADEALRSLDHYDWVVFTSGNGVRAVMSRLIKLGLDLRVFGKIKFAAIGPVTAEALRAFHLVPDLVPEVFRSEELAAALVPAAKGKRILLARADRGREILREELAAVAEVDQVAVYSQFDLPLDAAIARDLRAGKIPYVTLTSSNIARSFLRNLDTATGESIKAGKISLISISPVTSAALKEMGVPVAAEAKEYTTPGLVKGLLEMRSRGL